MQDIKVFSKAIFFFVCVFGGYNIRTFGCFMVLVEKLTCLNFFAKKD